ncbi:MULTISPECIES: diguanylate cyclase domain-containing protein [unclassified Roseofilum]|uniref:diguanylate cyclase domain-containing protein n=1 Tax=unclassified Roseofilum TaxID=2620099 RepID=UPI001B2F2EC1|nr:MULTISPECIES: diguanylate cyclase [unclassified Roseofilum]MBP0007714.1 diguanylate cyclase [Roseofilum sp. Belize Diploria]MBP0012471.1 diguanylate cyclase [Roseofilum sp. SID3]MBP0025133.1 diguanylate cyclase [Roseofilum sp. SID2]MBP0031618.1 diguanylate cyclase [Roseofilum sp. Belize BBD 4]MBP0037620.1 diguanylate cyclase [Roseofilum sp. SID1]
MININFKKIVLKPRIKKIIQRLINDNHQIGILDNRQIPILGELTLTNAQGYEIVVEDKILGWVVSENIHNSVAQLVIYLIEIEVNKKVLAADALDKYEELNFLYDISSKISTCLHVHEVIKLMANEAFKQIPGNALVVMIYNAYEQSMQTFYPKADENQVILGKKIPTNIGIYGSVFNSGKAEIVNQVTLDPRFIPQEFEIVSMMCCPLMTQTGKLGIIQISSDRTLDYTAQDLKLFTALASQAAASIQNALFYEQLRDYSYTLERKVAERTAELERVNQELNQLANLDGLTQVANRRCLQETFDREWYRLAREKSPLSIIICDVDYFKRYNDTYGHQMGDECLQKIAEAIKQALKRPADLVARYGGEEFVVILPNTQASGAWIVAQEIQEHVRHLSLDHQASLVSPFITMSMGLSSTIPTHETSGEELFEIADQALYEAKKQGRDRMIFREFRSPDLQPQ